MEPFRSHMHLMLVRQKMNSTINGLHLEKKEAKMDPFETFMKVAMAQNYFREKSREQNHNPDRPTVRPALMLPIQIAGRALMILGREVQIAGIRLVKFGQGGAD